MQNLSSSSLLSKNIKIEVYRTIIFHVIFCGCETWLLTLREECRQRVFENRVLRRIFGPKGDEVTREWIKVHNGELTDMYSSPNIIQVIKSRRMRCSGHVAHMYTGFWWDMSERGNLENPDVDGRLMLTHLGRVTQICVFNTRLFSLHNTLNYAIHRTCLRMVVLTDVYRNLTSL